MMTKKLLVLGAGLLALAASPVAAQSTGQKATATVTVNKPLQLTGERNLVFGTVLLGTFTGTQTVTINSSGRTCGAGGGLTCSGTFSTAQYRITGTNNQIALISSPAATVTLSNGAGATLPLTLILPASIQIDNSGNPGRLFEVGGSLPFTSAMADGVYTGTIDIQVAYQ
jgi:hypothetical protein